MSRFADVVQTFVLQTDNIYPLVLRLADLRYGHRTLLHYTVYLSAITAGYYFIDDSLKIENLDVWP